jgi:hypothetical protein
MNYATILFEKTYKKKKKKKHQYKFFLRKRENGILK